MITILKDCTGFFFHTDDEEEKSRETLCKYCVTCNIWVSPSYVSIIEKLRKLKLLPYGFMYQCCDCWKSSKIEELLSSEK